MGSAIERPVAALPVLPADLPLLERIEPSGSAAERVLRLPFEARSRSRQRARLDDGTEVGLVLPRGSVLRHGAVVSGAGLRVRIEAADEDVLEVRCPSPLALLRAAYHLGNRHVPVHVEAQRLLLGYDPVLSDMLVGLGASVRRTWLPFEPEAGAYAGHAHG